MNRFTFTKKTMVKILRPVVRPWVINPLRRVPQREREPIPGTMVNSGLNLNVMSFNIRRGTARDGKNHWIFRRNQVCELLNHYRPDVLGLQEALDFQISEIHATLPGYVQIGIGNKGGNKGLHTAVFYDAARFCASEEGTFWFSDTPDISGSKGWGNIIPRTCTWVRLIEKDSGQAFYFYNVHLDHLSPRSRKNSVALLSQFIHGRSTPDPFVLTGDFHAREKSAPIQYLQGKRSLKIRLKGDVCNSEPSIDSFRVRYPKGRNIATYHGFRRFFFRFKLDYIFVSPSVRVQDAEIVHPQRNKSYPSDHFPLLTHLDLPRISVSAKSGVLLKSL